MENTPGTKEYYLANHNQISAILKKAQDLSSQAHWLRKGADDLWECAQTNTKLTDNKRKAYQRDARREYKQAASLYAQAIPLLKEFLSLCPGAVKLGLYNDHPEIWLSLSEECLTKSKKF